MKKSSTSGGLAATTQASLWIFGGFLISFFLFQIIPVYFSGDLEMKSIRTFWPLKPIGIDLYFNMGFCHAFFVEHKSAYATGNLYPPLEIMIFGPLLLLDFATAYKTITVITLLCYVAITLGLPTLLGRERRLSPIVLLFTATGLISYGLSFELERGQFNVIAMTLCLLAIYLFHFQPRWRPAAYILFTASVHLKLYPAIFILLLVEDWRDWKANLKRFALIGAMNFVCLFAMGPQALLEFIGQLRNQTAAPLVWNGNHSISSHADLVRKALGGSARAMSLGMPAFYALLLGAIWLRAFGRRATGFNPYLLVACAIGALIIPSTSHDYTLACLTAPVAILLTRVLARESGNPLGRLGHWAALLAISFAYFATTCSIYNKAGYPPLFFATHAPMLLLILLGTAGLCFLDPARSDPRA